jgi:K+-sensing histidine kinase KdpD
MLSELFDTIVGFSDSPIEVRGPATEKESVRKFRVEDGGPGIPDEYREQVVEPFVQLRHHRDMEEVGLDLAIARWPVGASAGGLGCSHPKGDGVEFLLPLDEDIATLAEAGDLPGPQLVHLLEDAG